MLNTAICCELGTGTEEDPEKAFFWYKKSAEAGYDLAIFNLARCYRDGIGTEADPEQMYAWMKKLADTGIRIFPASARPLASTIALTVVPCRRATRPRMSFSFTT